jgi:transposase
LSPSKHLLAERRARRVARWREIHERQQRGESLHQIARALGISRKTVRAYLAAPEPPHNRLTRPRPGGLSSPTLAPYVSYLQDRWQAGCSNASKLFLEIQGQGYPGSRTLLIEAVRPWRGPKPPKPERQRVQRLTRRTTMRWLCLLPPEKLKPDERVLVEKVLAQDAILASGYDLLQQFRTLLKERDLPALEPWLEAATASKIPSFMSLANSIKDDWAAVTAAFQLPWSNGLLEGHVNRVKLLKRQMYGRAKFDLLRQRVLLG